MSTIDLETGEPDPDETPAARRRRERRSSTGSSSSGSSASRSRGGSKPDNTSLASRLDAAFTKIADQLMARGGEENEELATAIREESRGMSQGLVSLTATLTFLRWPLIVIMALVEPMLAFYRVGRLVLIRLLNWRERRIVAMQEAQQQSEWEAAQATPEVAVS